MLARDGYLEEYVNFWSARPEVNRIWVSVYTPQVAEKSPEILAPSDRLALAEQLTALSSRYRKLLFDRRLAEALLCPPASPSDCLFAKMSTNYSADLRSRVEPCVFGGTPDCSQCGCAASIAGSVKIGRYMNRLKSGATSPRWGGTGTAPNSKVSLVKIKSTAGEAGVGAHLESERRAVSLLDTSTSAVMHSEVAPESQCDRSLRR